MATQENPIDKLYSVLNRDGLYTKDINSFKQKYSTPQEVEKLYKVVNRDGYYTKDYNSFKEKYFPKSNEVSPQGSKNTSQTSTEPSVISQSNPFGGVQTVKSIDVPTNKVTTQKIVLGTNNAIQKAEKKGTDVVNSLGASMNSMNEGLFKIPRYIYDLASTPQNLISEYFNVPELATSYDSFLQMADRGARGVGQFQSPLSIIDGIRNSYANDVKGYEEKQIKYDDGIYNSLKKGNWSDAGSQLLNNIAASAPSLVLMATTSGAGNIAKLGTVTKTMVNALPFASSKSTEIESDTTIPNSIKPIYSGLFGLSEVIFDQKFGTQAIIDKIKDTFVKEGQEQAVKIGKDVATSYITKALKGIKEPLTDLGKNAIEEMTTQLSQNIIEKVVSNPEKDLMDGVIDAGIVGGAMGGSISGLGAVINSKSKASIKEKTEVIESLSNDLNTNIPDDAKEVLLSQIGKLKREVNNEIVKADENFNKLDEKGKEKAIELGSKIEDIDKSLTDETISDQAKQILNEQKAVLEEQLSEIKPIETPLEEVEITEEVITPTEEVKVTEEVVKPKYTIKGEQVTPKIKEETTNAVQKQSTGEILQRQQEEIGEQGSGRERVEQIEQGEEATQKSKEEVEVSGIKKSLVSQEVVDKVDFDKITDKEMQGLGKGLVESGEVKPKEIVDSITGGDRRALQPKEVVSLIYYKTDLDNQYRDLLKQKNELLAKGESVTSVDAQLADVQQEINNFEVTSVITANQQSLAFRLRKGLLDKDYNYATQVERYKATNNGVIEPEVEAKFKEYDKQLRELKQQIVEAEKRAKIAEENSAVQNIVEDVKRQPKLTGTKLKKAQAELKDAKEKFLKAINKSRGQMSSGGAFNVLGEAVNLIKAYSKLGIVKIEEVVAEMRKDFGSKFVDDNIENINKAYDTANLDRTKPYVIDGNLVVPNSYIRSVVENGITDINDISEQVLAEVKKDLPDATIREVRDAITRYGKTINQTADDITKQINQAKRLGRLYSKLEDLQKGINTSKTATRTAKLTEEERNVKKEIKDLENVLPKTEEQVEADNAKRIQAKKRYYERFIEEKQQRLKDKNYKPKPKSKPIIPDDELSRLEAKANEVRAKYDEAHFENEQLNRTKTQKFFDELAEWTSGLTRGLVAGLDASAFGVQLAIYSGTSNPSQVVEAVKNSMSAFASEKSEREFFAKLQTNPWFSIMKKEGLALQFPNSKLGSVDYQLSGNAINRVWNFVASPTKKIDEKLYERVRLLNPYRASERMFTSAVGTARVQLFVKMAEDLDRNGITYENNPEQYKQAAKIANILTFRGELGFLEPTSKWLAVGIFSPRKVSATLSMLNPALYVNTYRTSPIVAKELFLRMAKFVSLAVALTTAIKYSMDDEDDNSNPDLFNPYSSDFMKIRIGNTRIDMFGGMSSYVTLFARLLFGQVKKTSSYKTQELGISNQTPSRAGVIWDFTKNKFAPVTSYTFKFLEQSKGREVDWDTEVLDAAVPMWTTSISELFKENRDELVPFLIFMSFIGQSMNTYGTAEFLDKDKDKKYIDLLGRKNGAFQNRTRVSIKIIDEGSGEERGIDRVEYEVYKKEFGEYVKSELKSRYKELDEMTIPEFEKELKKIKKNAKEFAEFKVANSVGDLDKINQTVKGKQVNYELTPEQVRQRLKYNDTYINRFGNKSMTVRTKKFMQRDKLNKEQAEKEALIEMNKAANKYSEKMLLRDYRAKKIKLEIKE